MEFNQLPEGFEGEQKRKTEFDSLEAKLAYDAQGLIKKAALQSKRVGKPVDPISFAQRADDDIEALRTAIAKEQALAGARESVEVDPRLAAFKEDYDNSENPTLREKCSWAEIQTRLLANEGHYLALAQAMEQGGILFGVDAQGNPLIADRGDEPIMKGMNYKNTRDRVLYKHTSNDKDGTMILGEDQKPISTGYEMFPYVEPYDKSEEILQYEAHTGEPFVKSPNGTEWRSSWAESGENPSWPRAVSFRPDDGYASVSYASPMREFDLRGVRRLLRVKKV